jgi:hypothetical protein
MAALCYRLICVANSERSRARFCVVIHMEEIVVRT